MQMSSELVAAFNAALADPDGGWAFISAHEDLHEELYLDGINLATRSTRRVTVTLENETQGKMLICFLEGPANATASKLAIVLNGTRLETDDATLIQRFENAIPLLIPQVQAAAIEFFAAPEPDEEE